MDRCGSEVSEEKGMPREEATVATGMPPTEDGRGARGSGGTKGDKGALVKVQLLARGESEDGHMGEEGGDDRFGQGTEKGVGIISIHLPDESLSRAKLNPDRGAAPEPGEEGQGDEEIEEGG